MYFFKIAISEKLKNECFHKIKTVDTDVVVIAVRAFSKLLKVTGLEIEFEK